MKRYLNKIGRTAMVIVTVLIGGCTNLDENLYSELEKDSFYNSRLEVLQASLRPFTHMQAWLAPTGQTAYFYHAELSADQLAWPQKGRHGSDGGDHFRQHYHTWTDNENPTRTAWILMWTGIGYINSAIADLSEVDYAALDISEEEMAAIVAELHVRRAFHYMKIMELWGNVPIATEVAEAPTNLPTQPRAEVFEFVRTELETYVPQLLPYSAELVGRVSASAGYAMLAELYLNAEYFVGTPMWDECIEACDKIITGEAGGLGGTPQLADDLSATFSNTNQNATESLFQFAFSRQGGFVIDRS